MSDHVKQKPKILVVDDEPDNLDLLYRAFRREYVVLRAESGHAALEILEQEGDIAVIISDQRMPGMSGTEFLSQTATRYPDIIRIILTGYTDVEDLVEAINAGKVFKYVTKPWDDHELKAVVRQAVDTHNVLRTRTQELARTLQQESLLNAVTNTIRRARTYRQILQTLVNTVGQMFEASCCVLRSLKDDTAAEEWFVYHARHEKSQEKDAEPSEPELNGSNNGASKNPIPPIDELTHTIWETDDVLVIEDVYADPRTGLDTPAGDWRRRAYQTQDIRSSLLVPLMVQQELLAVLALHQKHEIRQWRGDEVQILLMVADQAALALSQARAYEQSQALAQRESLVNTITTAIRSSLDPQDIFAAITKNLGEVLSTDGCALSLWTEDDEYVQCVGLYDAADQPSQDGEERAASNAAVSVTTPEAWDVLQPAVTTQAQSHHQAATAVDNGHGGDPHRSLPQSLAPIEGNPVLLRLLETQQPVVVNDLAQHPELNMPDLPLRVHTRALLVVPLLTTAGKIIGSISLRQNDPRIWQVSEISLAQAVATQAAIAVQQSRLYQKTRQQAEQLMELDRQKTEFFQNISHEFRTPLTLTIGPLEAAVAQQQGLSYEQSEIALRNSRRLLRLVNQLLDLQRLDAGRMQPKFRPCNIEEFVSQITESFQPYCDRKQLQLITQLSPCPSVYLDAEKFDKVLYNLLSNAMKFTQAGGSITVRLYPDGEDCVIEVSDSGVGIRDDQIPYLFERFRQADGSENRSYEGSGLGLALVKELVDMHGGQIEVSSVYGKGTTFQIRLQTGAEHLSAEAIVEAAVESTASRALVELADIELDQRAAASASDPLPPTLLPALTEDEATVAPAIAANILVVDDNNDLRAYVSQILQQAGHEVYGARNGAEGYHMAESRKPDLIITDLMMPVVSGLDMIRQLRASADLRGIPIILLTAKADEDTRITGAEQGADAYLSKPFNNRELLAEVRNLLALKANERRIAELNTYLTESVLQRFLPPMMVEKAARGKLSLDLRPEPKLVTILFSDIVGFTQLSNTLRSRRVAELLNEYLEEMTYAIFDNGGTVDKFMGDAVLAIFGAPEEISPNEQVRRAIAAARQMYHRLDHLNEKWRSQGIGEVKFRCGIHQGTAVVGLFGGAQRSDYTAIGPSVNIAARIQEAADPDAILVSAAVADYLTENEIVKFSPLKLKGVDETVLTFGVKPRLEPAELPASVTEE